MRLVRVLALALALVGSAPAVLGDRVIFAQAVAYCSNATDPVLEVNEFQLLFNADQKSISFNINARSTREIRATLSLNLNAYDIVDQGFTINLCDILSGVLCPLPEYTFVGGATLPLPADYVDTFTKDVPGLAYTVPDLQATVTLRVFDNDTGDEATCLTADLSNGETARHDQASWALGGLAIAALVIAIARSLVNLWRRDTPLIAVERGRATERFVTYVGYLQFVASCGMLTLGYPNVYIAYALNFAWSVGLIYEEPVQIAINDARNQTGGNLDALAGQLVGGTEQLAAQSRSYANAVVQPQQLDSTASMSGLRDLISVFSSQMQSSASRLAKRQNIGADPGSADEVQNVGDVIIVDAVNYGIPSYTTHLAISPYNSFFTIFINVLFLVCIFVVVVAVLTFPFLLLYRRRRGGGDSKGRFRLGFDLLRANGLRLLLIILFPIFTFAFYTWISAESWLPIFLSAISVAALAAGYIFHAVATLIDRRRAAASGNYLQDFGGHSTPLWNIFRPDRWWFFLVLNCGTLLRALFLGFAQGHGWVQSIAHLIIEILEFVAICVFLPFNSRSSNGTRITVQIARFASAAILVALNESLPLTGLIRAILGFVLIAIQSLVVILFFVFIVIDLVKLVIAIFRKPRHEERVKVSPPSDGSRTAPLSQASSPDATATSSAESATLATTTDEPRLKGSQ